MTLQEKLFALQGKLQTITKDSNNPFFNSKYFDINKLIGEVKPHLQESGLVLLQPLEFKDGRNIVSSVIWDSESGEKITSEMALPDLSDPQKMGSATTYLRRYTLQSLLALQADDDDANLASGRQVKLQEESRKPVTPEVQTGDTASEHFCSECQAPMVHKTGEVKTGKNKGRVYQGWFCPTPNSQHKPSEFEWLD